MLVDSHCHIQSEEFDDDRPDVIRRTQERGMACIVVGNREEDSGRAVELAHANDNLYAAVGLHPMFLHEEEFEPEVYERFLSHEKVVAIGEIGLDYYHLWADSEEEEKIVQQQQAELFVRQLEFAKEHGKPAIIHCRDAYEDLLAVLADWKDYPMVIHTFLGDVPTAEKFLALGCMLSLSGIITFAGEEELAATIRSVPLDRMMIETDSPLLTPVPYRGKRNEPLYVEEVAKKISELRSVPVEEIIETTGRNALQFFRIERD